MTLWHRWMRFNGVGALGIGVQIAVIAMLANLWHLDYRVATFAGVAAAILHNFLWHRLWTWADRRERAVKAFVRFAAANGLVSLGGNMVVTTVLVWGAHVAVVPANVGAIVICSLANFWLADRVVFGGRARNAAAERPISRQGRPMRSMPVPYGKVTVDGRAIGKTVSWLPARPSAPRDPSDPLAALPAP